MMLTGHQIGLITASLRVAQEKYLDKAKLLRATTPQQIRLAEQLERQAKDVAELAREFDCAYMIELFDDPSFRGKDRGEYI